MTINASDKRFELNQLAGRLDRNRHVRPASTIAAIADRISALADEVIEILENHEREANA